MIQRRGQGRDKTEGKQTGCCSFQIVSMRMRDATNDRFLSLKLVVYFIVVIYFSSVSHSYS